MARRDQIYFEDARIIFRNFSGEKSKFNTAGTRDFAVVIEDPDAAQRLIDDGWNVKFLEPREPDEPRICFLKVAVSYAVAPPKIFVVNGRNKVLLDEETVGELDYADISTVDLSISPYHWEVNGKTGIKAYAATMYVNVTPDPFADKYKFE